MSERLTSRNGTPLTANEAEMIKKLAGRSKKAEEICRELVEIHFAYAPALSQEGVEIFDRFNEKASKDPLVNAQHHYQERNPLKMLQEQRIEGAQIVRLLRETEGSMNEAYFAVVTGMAKGLLHGDKRK